jgi:hypothetical protein
MSLALGRSVPVPFCSTREARPDADFAASAGGLATLSGAGIGVNAGFCCAVALSPNAVTTARAERNLVIRQSYQVHMTASVEQWPDRAIRIGLGRLHHTWYRFATFDSYAVIQRQGQQD